MKVRFYGGRVGFGIEWEEEFIFDSDSTEDDIENVGEGYSADFMDYVLVDAADNFDFWYEWELIEGEWKWET